jgi:uncharacterized membrane protein
MLNESMLQHFKDDVVMVEHRLGNDITKLVPHWKHAHPPVRNVNKEVDQSFSALERLALVVTRRVGTPGFFLLIAAWTVIWLLWNTIAPRGDRFDPAPAFVLWLFISNMIQIFLMPLIMVGQNLLNRHAEMQAEADFQINQTAEREIGAILLHLEHQAAVLEHQGDLSLQILHRLEPAGAAAADG